MGKASVDTVPLSRHELDAVLGTKGSTRREIRERVRARAKAVLIQPRGAWRPAFAVEGRTMALAPSYGLCYRPADNRVVEKGVSVCVDL